MLAVAEIPTVARRKGKPRTAVVRWRPASELWEQVPLHIVAPDDVLVVLHRITREGRPHRRPVVYLEAARLRAPCRVDVHISLHIRVVDCYIGRKPDAAGPR